MYLKLPSEIPRHWNVIQDALSLQQRWTPKALVGVIDKIRSSSYKQVKDMPSDVRFSGLLQFFKDSYVVNGDETQFWGNKGFGSPESNSHMTGWFLAHTIPFMAGLVLRMSKMPRLKLLDIEETSVQECILSRTECASLLACSFFCGFHYTSAPTKKFVNFDSIFISLNKKCPQNVAKMWMLMNYFERCRLEMYDTQSHVTIRRLHQLHPKSSTTWRSIDIPLTDFTVEKNGSISDAGPTSLHVDFANRWIGGGVLNRGSVQEEIMFSVCPELLCTIHLCGVMNHSEAITVSGADEYSLHTGYSRQLKYAGDSPQTDEIITRVAMDATRFTGDRTFMRQYSEESILRELNKAFVAFDHDLPFNGSPVATGNWGCGAFAGHVQLKSMLQWIAASACSRPVSYFTFKDPNCEGIEDMTLLLIKKEVSVGQLFGEVIDFAEQVEVKDKPDKQLFTYLRETFE